MSSPQVRTPDERKSIQPEDYGISKTKEFPLMDRKQVTKAIQMFKFAKEENRKELAFKLKLRADKYKIDIHENHPLQQYLNEGYIVERGFGLTARYAGHRLMNASLNTTTLESVRISLEKTVAGTTKLEDLDYLRQDMNQGKTQLNKKLARITDTKEIKEIKEHLAWMSGPYTAMINKRAKELRSSKSMSLKEELLIEKITIKKKEINVDINKSTIQLNHDIIKKNLQTMNDSGNTKLKEYSERISKARTKEEKEAIAEDIRNNIKALEAVKSDTGTSLVLQSLKVVGGIIIIVPGSFLLLAGAALLLVTAPVVVLGGLLMTLVGNAMAFGGYLMSSKEVENKSMDKVLDIMITKHEKLLAKAK